MPKLVFLYGPPAAGKFTVAKELSQRIGIPLFHNHDIDDVVGQLFEFGSDAFIHLRESMWLTVLQETVLADKSLIFTFTPESTVRPSLIDDIKGLYTSPQSQCIFIAITCSDKTSRQRLQDPLRQPYSTLKDPQQFDRLLNQGAFEFDYAFTPVLIVNTDAVKPKEACQLIIRELTHYR